LTSGDAVVLVTVEIRTAISPTSAKTLALANSAGGRV
jgi:hypothetical protein